MGREADLLMCIRPFYSSQHSRFRRDVPKRIPVLTDEGTREPEKRLFPDGKARESVDLPLHEIDFVMIGGSGGLGPKHNCTFLPFYVSWCERII